MSDTQANKNYSAENIKVLEGLEAVRKRPAMYIGDVGKRGLHHLVYEVVDNSIDEALAGYCSRITVVFNKDGSVTVEDNGRGIPVDIHKEEKKPAVEVVMTVLHAGGKFDKGSYKVSGGLHGVGVSVVNALSEWMWVEVKRDGKVHRQEYKIGEPQTDLKTVGTAKKTGTKVCFYPDNNIFKTIGFEYDIISERLRELAYLNKGIEIQLKDERSEDGESDVFKFKGGLSDFVKYLDEHNNPLHNKIITVNREDGEVPVEVALRYGNTYNDNILTFVNNINTIEGGTHLSGFRSALTRAMNNHASKNNLIKAKKNEKITLTGEDFREGLTAIVSVKVAEPQFEGQTKTKLGNGDVKGVVDKVVYEGILDFLEQNPSIGRRIIEKALLAARSRSAARKARELIRRKSALGGSSLPGKLSDCSNRDPVFCELYLVEGDSAESPSTKYNSQKTGSRFEQSDNLPGREEPPRALFLRISSRALRAADLLLAASRAFSIILLPIEGFCSRKSNIPSYTTLSTTPLTSPLPSLVFVCPSNWGSATLTLTIAVNPSRKSSPVSVIFSFFFALIRLFFEAWLFIARVSADLNPDRWVPPSIVLMLFTKVKILSL